ncbi:DMBT1 protein, partial [Scopus umbretta]|nr:DMBT1 protein [Scopus umbretta]
SGVSMAAELRLANGSTHCEGRVEVAHNGTWAALCDEGWSLAEAQVVCRQLGCGRALSAPGGSHFGQGPRQMRLDSVSCVGTETALSVCKTKPRGNGTCHHGKEAGVVCAGNSENDQVRLVNYGSRCAGRVEIFHNAQWGTVCDDNWDLLDAEVVCRQLDCGRALSAPGGGQFGRGDGIIWMDETNCTGSESTLSACRARPWGINNCYHGEDAGVVCSVVSSFAPVRLVDGPGRCAGRVEVFHNEKWGTVCDDSWDFMDAKVVCRQLDCGTVVLAPRRARFGQGQGPIWLDNVNCMGTEAALSECRAKGWGVHGCEHGEDASVVCSGNHRPSSEALRLVNGPHHCAGRVEVFHNKQWGTICDDGWDLNDAAVVCRQLGCGMAVSAPGLSGFGQGSGPIWLDGVSCRGTEATLTECPAKPWSHHTCNHVEDAGVVCSGNP